MVYVPQMIRVACLFPQEELPAPPADLLFQVSQNADPAAFMISANGMAYSIVEHFGRVGGIPQGGLLLDFGCGVGKALIGLRRVRPDLTLFGCDLDARLIDWCRSHLKFAHVYQNALTPPLQYASDTFDAINAVSVFTHLSIMAQFQWAWELYRVLKPGGHLHFTTHGPGYMSLFAYVATTRRITHLEIYTLGPDAFFVELEQPVENENYVSKVGEAVQGQLEIAIAHNKNAVAKIFAPFKMVDYLPQQPIGDGHDAYILQKPLTAVVPVCVCGEHFQVLAKQRVVYFEMPLNGQDNFVVFVTDAHPGVHRQKLLGAMKVSLDRKVFYEATQELSAGTRIFGKWSYTPIEVKIPAGAFGKLRVEIAVSSTDGVFPEMLHWLMPHAYRDPHA